MRLATEDVAQYYRRRAAADVGLIVSEGAGVDRPASLNDPNMPRFHGQAELAAWKRVIDEVHTAGGAMAPQPGRKSSPSTGSRGSRLGVRKAAPPATAREAAVRRS